MSASSILPTLLAFFPKMFFGRDSVYGVSIRPCLEFCASGLCFLVCLQRLCKQ